MTATIDKDKTIAGEFIEREGATLTIDTAGRLTASKIIETANKKGASFYKAGLVYRAGLFVEQSTINRQSRP